MKGRKLLIPLLLLISCMLMFSACSNGTGFDFDENNTVKLTYTCMNEEKCFYTELTAEQSRSFIRSLNKITYVEVTDKDIDFGPSYDYLRITVGNGCIDLYDVWSKINNGGYLYFNGKLCQSKDKFGFLGVYLNEYDPDMIPSSVSFGVQYVKQTVGAEENHKIIRSVSGLNEYIATEKQKIHMPDYEFFKDEVVAKYNDEYFEKSFLVIFMKEAGSGSFDFRVNDVGISSDKLIIGYKIVEPTGDVDVTCDMAYWYSFVELSNEYSSISSVHLIASK